MFWPFNQDALWGLSFVRSRSSELNADVSRYEWERYPIAAAERPGKETMSCDRGLPGTVAED